MRQVGDGVPHSTKRVGTGRSGGICHPRDYTQLPEQIVGVILHIDVAHAGARLLGLGGGAVPGTDLMSFVIGRIRPRAPHDQRDRTRCALEQFGRLIATPLDEDVVDGQQHIPVTHACLVRRGARYDVTERGSLQVSSRRRRSVATQRSSAVISVHYGGILTCKFRPGGPGWKATPRQSEVIRGNQAHLQVSSRRARLESDPEETVGILSEGDGHGDYGEHEKHLLMREALRGH